MLAQAQRPQQAAPATAPKLASPASARQRKDAPAPRLPNPLGASIRRWWQAMGRGAYPGARQLLIRARSRTFCTTLRNAEEVDARRPRPTDKRVWASVEKSARKVICEAFEEAQRRDPERRRRWVVLVDGEPKQLRAVKAEVRRLRLT